MKTQLMIGGLLAGLSLSAAVPVVSNVTTVQADTRQVKVNYTLSGEPGIVTLTAQTNRGDNVWIDVDDANLTFVSGDVNRIVPVGNRSLTWLPHKSWPDQFITGGNIRIGVKAWAKDNPPDYMVLGLVAKNDLRFFTSAAALPDGGLANDKYKTEYLVMRRIPAANVTWRKGSPVTPPETGRDTTREVPYAVTLPKDYYIGVYQVTQKQYQYITGKRPSYFNVYWETRPVEKISWNQVRGGSWPNGTPAADTFFKLLQAQTGLTGLDLPTDAQYEFACRAGSGTALYNGMDYTDDNVKIIARCASNCVKNPAPTDSDYSVGIAEVGSYLPNAWGLYDMLGNGWEWCLDWLRDSTEGVDPLTGPETGSARMLRGGGWNSGSSSCRCAKRNGTDPNAAAETFTFRVACPAEF